MTHRFSVINQEEGVVERDIQVARFEDETFLIRMVTQWKGEPTPVITEIHLTDTSLILLKVAVDEAVTNLNKHKVEDDDK